MLALKGLSRPNGGKPTWAERACAATCIGKAPYRSRVALSLIAIRRRLEDAVREEAARVVAERVRQEAARARRDEAQRKAIEAYLRRMR